MNTTDVLDGAAARLRGSSDIEFSWRGEERDQAETMLEHLLGRAPFEQEQISATIRRKLDAMIERRCGGEPLAYIVGFTIFRDLRMNVRPGGFIPRATSEFLAENAIKRINRRSSPIAIDLATGVGPVALAIAHSVPKARVYGADVAESAIVIARSNAKSLNLKNVSFHCGDLWAPVPENLKGKVDVITAHPPYVPRGEISMLPIEIRGFEPLESLTDKSVDGRGLIARILDEAPDWLRPSGWLAMELHPSDTRAVRGLMQRVGLSEVRSLKGDMPYTRVVVGRL